MADQEQTQLTAKQRLAVTRLSLTLASRQSIWRDVSALAMKKLLKLVAAPSEKAQAEKTSK